MVGFWTRSTKIWGIDSMQLLRFAPLAASLVACAALEEASVVRDKLHRYMGEERFDEVCL